ncbi:MAG: hypothetical protein WBC44_00600 [Planctomycetaceae bacterium]
MCFRFPRSSVRQPCVGGVLAVLLATTPAAAQAPADDAAASATEAADRNDRNTGRAADPAAPADRTESAGTVRVHLMEGSVVSGTLSVDALTVKTAFGTLEIPVEHVVSFTPGLASHPQLQDRIGRLIQKLGSNDAAERDQAQRELTDFGPGIRPQLERHRKDPDAERRTRIEKILEDVELQANDDSFAEDSPPSLIAEDTVETDRFTIVGQIAPESFRVETPFGPLTVALKDIRYVARETDRKPEVRARAAVDASNLPQIGLKDTGVRLQRGDRVSVTASGSIVMTPWGNNVTSSPDGAGMNVPVYANGIPSGALIGRIGRNGEDLLIGARNEFTATSTGTLYLGVAMAHQFANQGYTFPGTYEVRLRVNPPEN